MPGEDAIRLSVVVPTLDEAGTIGPALADLERLRAAGHELIVVDGGSRDGTLERAAGHVDRALSAPRGRAVQMNAGARQARGDVLVFLHADSRLPADAERAICDGLARSGHRWGCFDVRLSGPQRLLRVVERLMSWRSRLSRIATGDQALFVRRDLFEDLGGFPEIPLMEDIALCRLLKRSGPPLRLRGPVVTSSRRWERRGILRTVVLMWGLRLLYFLGVDPARLARYYAAVR